MQRLAVILGVLVGCYQDPEYGATSFRCDATHDCPEGQTCVAGRCGGAAPGDDSGNGGADGVACGGQTCGASQQCCVDFVGAPTCLAAGAICNGFGATCDGVEDCNGSPCCLTGVSITCGAACGDTICLQMADCPAAAPRCCFNLTAGEPWGHCLTNCP